MRYLGGKSKIAKKLATAIGGGDLLIEPFCGGGAMTAVLSQTFKEIKAYDIHEDLILMWKALKRGWIPPTSISELEYSDLRGKPSSALRGFAGFAGASWGGKWFGGYARGGKRNYADEAHRSLMRDIKLMDNVEFEKEDYKNLFPPIGCTIYADPPYEETTGYANGFNNKHFWQKMDEWVDVGCRVFVSEYKAPSHWNIIWEMERTRDMKSKMTNAVKITERLYTREKVS